MMMRRCGNRSPLLRAVPFGPGADCSTLMPQSRFQNMPGLLTTLPVGVNPSSAGGFQRPEPPRSAGVTGLPL
mgnify:CR=1 FL=1